MTIIEEAVENILCCPISGESLTLRPDGRTLSTAPGNRTYALDDGIFILMPLEETGQAEERQIREKTAREHGDNDAQKILETVSLHHCRPVMEARARAFRGRFGAGQWLLDAGCGTGYYWRKTEGAAKLVLMDFALNNLRAARELLRGLDNVIYVQADASRMPFRDNAISGVWSVQVTQHFPDEVMKAFMEDLRRVLAQRHRLEIYNLNPALFLRMVFRLTGKPFHRRGRQGDVTLNKYDGAELRRLWREWTGTENMRTGFSELFFHPDFRLRPQCQAVAAVEQWIGAVPWLPGLFARQVHVEISDAGI